MTSINRLINFTQTGEKEWSTNHFQIGGMVGRYKICPIFYIEEAYELIRIIDGRGTSVSHIATAATREELAIVAENNLLNFILLKIDVSKSVHGMIDLVKLLDSMKFSGDEQYDMTRIRDKAIYYIRLACKIEFLDRGMIHAITDIIKSRTKLGDIKKDINESLYLLILTLMKISDVDKEDLIKLMTCKESILTSKN